MNGDVNTQTPSSAHTRTSDRERGSGKTGSETLLHRPLADIRDPRRAASPRQMQRSRIPLSSPISVCILRNENERREEHVNVDEHGEHGVRTRTRGRCRRRRRRCRRRRPHRGCARDTGRAAGTSSPGVVRAALAARWRGGRPARGARQPVTCPRQQAPTLDISVRSIKPTVARQWPDSARQGPTPRQSWLKKIAALGYAKG